MVKTPPFHGGVIGSIPVRAIAEFFQFTGHDSLKIGELVERLALF